MALDTSKFDELFALRGDYPRATSKATGDTMYFGRGRDGRLHMFSPRKEYLHAESCVWLPEIARRLDSLAKYFGI